MTAEEAQHGRVDDDLWAWMDQDDEGSLAPEIDPAAVVAVMVVHDAEDWLARQLLSLAGLDPRPGRLIAVDAASTDDSRALLGRALAEGVVDVVLDAPDATFGAAVAQALDGSEPEWIWLLHDDSAPERDALAHLLEGARRSDVVVPKLLEPKRRNYPSTISEAGQAITRGGIRVPVVDEGEIDQHQTEARDVLGASTAGLLVRGEAWREVGGLAPEVERHRDGVDLCWRINAVGFRVLTWPAAALVHRRAGRTGERPHDRHPHEDDRLAALRVAGARGASGIGLAASSALRAFGFLLAKSPAHAGAELRALRRYGSSKATTKALAERLPDEDMTPEDLLPNRFWPLRTAVDRLGNAVSDRYRDLMDKEADTSIDELTSDEYSSGQARRRVFSPVTALVAVLLLAGVIAGRTLLPPGPAAGGGLLPAPSSWGGAWQAYATGDAPWLGVPAVLTALGLGNPGWFALLTLVGLPLAAGVAALALARRFGAERGVGTAVAAAWAGATLLLGLVTAGDVTGMALAVVGPLLARALHRWADSRAGGVDRLRAPAAVGFWLLLGSVFWPVLLILATVALVVWALRDRSRAVEAVVAVLPAWAVLAPWLPSLFAHPGRWVTGADPMAWPDYPPASYAMVLGRILPSGFPVWANVAFFALLGLVAVISLARLGRAAWAWSVGAIAIPLLIGTLLSRFVVGVDGGSVRVLTSPWALLVVAALLAPVVLASRGERPRAIALGGLWVAGLIAAVTWAVVGFNGPVRPQPSALPGYVADVVSSPRDTRVLLVELTDEGELGWNVVDQRHPQWGSGEGPPAAAFTDEFYVTVQAIASGTVPEDLAERLRRLGVSHLWLRGFSPDQRAALDNAAGLTSAAADDATAVWTVVGLVSRSFVLGETLEPVVDATLEPGDADRRLEVAEPADSAWVATLDGEPLERVDGSDRLTFQIGEGGGDLQVQPATHTGRLILHLAVLALLALLAAPSMGGASVSAKRGQA